MFKTKRQGSTERPLASRLSFLTCIACVLIFLASTQLENNSDSLDAIGYASATQIWSGAWWALISTVFIHVDPIHLFMNLSGLWYFGNVMEDELGQTRYAVFFVFSAFVSSAAQLAASDQMGIGASGVLFSIAGFMWASRRRVKSFARTMEDTPLRLFIAWGVLCIIISQLEVMNMGNTAHFSGLLFGLATGALYRAPKKQFLPLACSAALLLLTSVSLLWNPWSVRHQWYSGIRALESRRFVKAERIFGQLIRSDKQWKASHYWNRGVAIHRRGDYERAELDFAKAKSLNPDLATQDKAYRQVRQP